MQVPILVLGTLLVLAGAEGRPVVKASPEGITLEHCLISLSEESQVPAEEPGVLAQVMVKDGQQVAAGQMLAQIDDARAQMEHKVALLKLDSAREKAANDVDVRYAKKAAKVAEFAYLQKKDANDRVPGTVSRTEMEELRLTHERSLLQIEQSEFQLRTDALEARVREAEVEAAAENLDRRRVKAPLDGVVVELRRHAGEWVQPGDPILRIMRVQSLRIEGFLRAADYAQADLGDRLVTVRVTLAHGRPETFQGKIVYVDPQVQTGGEFLVRAEVFNRQENGYWLLSPGMAAEMTIHLR